MCKLVEVPNDTYHSPRFSEMILVCDIGASYGLTTFCCGFIDYVWFNINVKYFFKVNNVVVIVAKMHKLVD